MKLYKYWIIFALIILYLITPIINSSCTKDATIGVNKPEQVKDKVDSKSGQIFMMRHNNYVVPCCGAISQWSIYIKNPGTIRFQVWRALGTGEYSLVGENLATYHKKEENNLVTVSVGEIDQIAVKDGDFIGWYNENTPMVSYAKEKDSAGALIYDTRKPIPIGDITDWSSVAASDPRTYAIQAKVTKGLKPNFKNLPSSITIVSDLSPGSEIYQLAFDGVDGVDVPSYFTAFLDGFSEYFAYNDSVNSVYIEHTPPKGKYSLSFSVRDQCGNKDSGALKIEVETKLPAILNLPSAISVREDSHNSEVMLLEIDVVHSGPIACSLREVIPSHGKKSFLVRNSNDSLPFVLLKATAHLSYSDEDTYELTIKCAAGKESDIGSLFVNVEPNSAPQFENLPSTITVHADEGIIGGVIYHVIYSDEENNPVFYNVSCDPHPCPFDVTQGGSISVIDDLRTAVSNVFYLEITIEDNFNVAGPEILVVNITGLNRPPFIYNIPDKATVTLQENSPPGTSVFQVLAVDQDEFDNLTFTIKAKPTNMIPLFSINETTGVIYALTPFDYEGMKSKNIKLYPTVSDGTDQYSRNLKVSIIDINEPPVFQYDNYTIFTGENGPGKVIAKNKIKASDHDKGDNIVYHLDCGRETDLFQINEHSADITQAYELDVDRLGVAELEIMCVVTATDTVSQSSNASVRFVITDEDDNAPDFERTSYLFVATKDLPLFTTLGRTFATDLDTASINSKLFYYMEEETSDFVTDDNGTIHLVSDLTMVPVGTVYKFTMAVEDGNGKKDTAPVTIVVLPGNYQALVSSLVAQEITFFDLPENMAWFVTAVYLLVTIVLLVVYLCGRTLRCTIEIIEFDESRSQNFTSSFSNNSSRRNTTRSSIVSVYPSDTSIMNTECSTATRYSGSRRSSNCYDRSASTSTSSRVKDESCSPRNSTSTPRSVNSRTPRGVSRVRSQPTTEYPDDNSMQEINSYNGQTSGKTDLNKSYDQLDDNETGNHEEKRAVAFTITNKSNMIPRHSMDEGTRQPSTGSKLSSEEIPSIQSRLSLSDIQPTTKSFDQTPWKPWAISDFKTSSSKSKTNHSDHSSSHESQKSQISKRRLSLNF